MRKIVFDYRVPYAETDQMGVVYYANYFVYFERIRTELLRDCNLPYKELEAQGIFLPVIESHCNYFNSARYDDLLQLEGAIDYIKGAKVKIDCRVYCSDNNLLAEGYTIHAAIDAAGKPCRAKNVFASLF